jgi:alpha-1,6-mannosyl-glycoprotein beta-1,2-N-acetylglucosaminyltransferase
MRLGGFTVRSFIKYLITISLLFTFLINLKFRQRFDQHDSSSDGFSFTQSKNENKTSNTERIENLKEIINVTNNEYSTVKSNNSLIILVQVHKRVRYLEMLIKSLNYLIKQRQNDSFLVIFSHDYYDVEINELIKNESKFLYKQIFYPYMLQLFENKFPGKHPNDCPKTAKKHEALKMRCNNAASPDSYGNYREYNIVQIKHHWFWKLAFVFENYLLNKNNKNAGVLLLEEDYYLMPDALFVLDKLKKKLVNIFFVLLQYLSLSCRIKHENDIISLAYFENRKQNIDFNRNGLKVVLIIYSELYLMKHNFYKYGRALWNSANHNTGLFISRSLWNKIKDCANVKIKE